MSLLTLSLAGISCGWVFSWKQFKDESYAWKIFHEVLGRTSREWLCIRGIQEWRSYWKQVAGAAKMIDEDRYEKLLQYDAFYYCGQDERSEGATWMFIGVNMEPIVC